MDFDLLLGVVARGVFVVVVFAVGVFVVAVRLFALASQACPVVNFLFVDHLFAVAARLFVLCLSIAFSYLLFPGFLS